MYILRRVAKFVSYQYTGQTRPQMVKSVMIMAQFPYGQKWDMSLLVVPFLVKRKQTHKSEVMIFDFQAKRSIKS